MVRCFTYRTVYAVFYDVSRPAVQCVVHCACFRIVRSLSYRSVFALCRTLFAAPYGFFRIERCFPYCAVFAAPYGACRIVRCWLYRTAVSIVHRDGCRIGMLAVSYGVFPTVRALLYRSVLALPYGGVCATVRLYGKCRTARVNRFNLLVC